MARQLSVVNSESERLGEIPTTITYPPQWPYGRYTHPAGGRFIREYGQTGPLPEALTELRGAEVESPRARAYLDGTYIEKSPELSPHEWGETTRPMSEVEREYLAAWGRPRSAGGEVGEVALTEGEPNQSLLEKYKYPLMIAAGVTVCVVGLAVAVR